MENAFEVRGATFAAAISAAGRLKPSNEYHARLCISKTYDFLGAAVQMLLSDGTQRAFITKRALPRRHYAGEVTVERKILTIVRTMTLERSVKKVFERKGEKLCH
jgi:hypothetical protein